MSDISVVLEDLLGELGWPWRRDDDADRIVVPLTGRTGEWDLRIYVLDDTRRMLALSVLPMNVAPERRSAMCETLNRANFGLVNGSFEMDMDSGEVRCRTAVDLDGAILSPSLLRHVLLANAELTDTYHPAIMRVSFGEQAPEEAIAAVEPA